MHTRVATVFSPKGWYNLAQGKGESPPPWVITTPKNLLQPERLRHAHPTGFPMPQSLARNTIHLIFSTQNRQPLIAPGLDKRLFAYLAGTLNELKCPTFAVGGVADHVHILFSLARTISLSDAVEEVKKSSSKWMKQNGVPKFYWQGGYGAFSVSASKEKTVSDYIANQSVKHRKLTFQDELRAFLTKHRMEWDERFLWD
jgi:putative transposase